MKNVLLVAVAFFVAFILNDQAFKIFVLNDYVALIFIPSGVRIFSVLVFERSGALGVFIGSLLTSVLYLGLTDVELVVFSAAVASGTAFISRMACIHIFRLDTNFRNITLPKIFGVCVIFSIVSSLGHQSMYHAMGLGTNFTDDVFNMFIGDIIGALIFLVASRYIALAIKRL